jgi:hypothetical protein
LKSENKVQIPGGSAQEITNQGNLYQTENGLRKNCGSPPEVRAQKRHTYFGRVSAICKKRHTYFVRVSAIFANQFCLGIKQIRHTNFLPLGFFALNHHSLKS